MLGEATLTHVVRDERAQLMARVREQLDREAQVYGITWSTCASAAPICRSRTARRSTSACRPSGNARPPSSAPRAAQRAQEIRSRADRDVTVLLAEATSKAEQIRGEGDGERNRIFAEAFGKDPDFFAFYRSMQAYEAGLRQQRHAHGACSRIRSSSATSSIRQASRATGSAAPAPPAAPGATR